MSTEKDFDPNTVIKNPEFAQEFATLEIPFQESAKAARRWGLPAVSDYALKGMHVGNEEFTPLVDHIELDNVNKDEFNIANKKLGYSKIQISQLWNNLAITDSSSRTGIHFGSRLDDGSFYDDGHYHVLDVPSLQAFVQGLPRKNIRYIEDGHEHRLRPRNLFGKKELEMITRFVDNYGSLPTSEENLDLSDAEREQRLLALAAQYTKESNSATPDEMDEIGKKWNDKLHELGVRRTNNLHSWFNPDSGLFGAYDIHGKTTEAHAPAVVYLRQLEKDEPELFKACVEADQNNEELFGPWLERLKSTGATKLDVNLIRTRWLLDLRMTTAFNHMLTYPGATEELLDALCV